MSDIGSMKRYHLLEDLGRCDRVKVARDTTDEKLVAIRFISRWNGANVDYIEREILSRRALYHHHLIGFREVFMGADNLCIVMQYAPGGDMLNFVKRQGCLSEEWARRFFQQLIIAVAYIHHKNLFLSDIKLENLLLDEKQQMLCLCDLNLKDAYAGGSGEGYLPPELQQRKDGNNSVDSEKIDVFRCGVCLFFMLFGRFPAVGAKGLLGMRTYRKNPDGKISSDCKRFLSHILKADPDERPTVDDIMKTPWFEESLPEGTQEYNERLKVVKADVIETALGLQTERAASSIVRAAFSSRSKTMLKRDDQRNNNEIEGRWLCRLVRRSRASLKSIFHHDDPDAKKNISWTRQLMRRSMDPVQRFVHYVVD